MPEPSTVLLIGAGGLVGRHLHRALTDVRTIPTFHGGGSGAGLQLDITDHEAVRRTIREAKQDVILLVAADAYASSVKVSLACPHRDPLTILA